MLALSPLLKTPMRLESSTPQRRSWNRSAVSKFTATGSTLKSMLTSGNPLVVRLSSFKVRNCLL